MRATEFTDGISGDWGGKPFIDLLNGWKYALNQHPEVKVYRRLFCSQLDDAICRLIQREQLPQVLAGVDMLSSTCNVDYHSL